MSNLSFENVQQNTSDLSFGESKKSEGLNGNLLENSRRNLQEIGAGVSTLAGAIMGTDKEARASIGNLFKSIADDPRKSKELINMMLSTYNITVDDIGEMPLGEVVGNIAQGAWQHPVEAALDIFSLGSAAGIKIPNKLRKSIKFMENADVRVKAAEKVLQDNIRVTNRGEDFVKAVNNIEKKYTPDLISDGFKWIETKGLKTIPKPLTDVVHDLIKANDIYKEMYVSAGVKLADDVEMATRELLAQHYKVPVSKMESKAFMNSDLYKNAKEYVVKNDVRPIFHLEPKIIQDMANAEEVTSDLLKRKFGTMDYAEAGKDITRKADTFTQRLVRAKVNSSVKSVNKYIDEFNEINGTNVKPLDTSKGLNISAPIKELNNELRKTMLGGGTYLGANVLSTTLTILNNFNLGAAKRTLKKTPKFRLIELDEAKTPLLSVLSKYNNTFYRPIASVDKLLERIGARYIEEVGLENAKFMQSMVPTLAVTTNPIMKMIREFVPFGSYPAAAISEVAATVKGKPEKAFTLTQIQKIGQNVNKDIQENTPGLKEVDTSKVIRRNDEGKLVQSSSIITPIQAANMFLLGEQGDAVQIPIINFINNLVAGKGDPNVFTINGKQYRVDKGKIKTQQGDFDLLPSISYIARQTMTPVQFYNQVLVPLMSDKYIKNEHELFNKMVSDTEFSNMGIMSKRKVKEHARERLAKKIVGTYEYDYFKPYVSNSTKRQIRKQQMIQKNLERQRTNNDQ